MLPPSSRLLGQVAIITGGARGIGAAVAALFAQNGAHVVVADILDEQGAALADSIGARYVHCDVSKESDVEGTVQFALAWKGQLDIVVNNAGIPGFDGSIENLDMDEMTHIFSVNFYGMVHGIKHGARAMIKGGRGGSIICMSSSAGIMGGLGSHSYTSSKAAILALMRSCACELGVHGIRVNCVSPHGVPSEMLLCAYRKFLGKPDVSPEDVRKVIAERASLIKGRGGSEEDAANATLFLASEESGFITGHNLIVDGGYTAACSNMRFIYN